MILGAKVWVGAGFVIGPGVTVGDNSVIGAGSVVMRGVAANPVLAGNPCPVLRRLCPGIQRRRGPSTGPAVFRLVLCEPD
jgi:acetyltransferase-like isoleucine patch superfamily enzyme